MPVVRGVVVAGLTALVVAVGGCSVSDSGGSEGSGDCSSWNGPNPSIEQTKAMWAEFHARDVSSREKYGLPTLDAASLTDWSAKSVESARELFLAIPENGVADYTNWLCDAAGPDVNGPGARRSVDQLRGRSGIEDANLDSYIAELTSLLDQYPSLSVEYGLAFCGPSNDRIDAMDHEDIKYKQIMAAKKYLCSQDR